MVATDDVGGISSPGKGKRVFWDVGNISILIWILGHRPLGVCVCVWAHMCVYKYWRTLCTFHPGTWNISIILERRAEGKRISQSYNCIYPCSFPFCICWLALPSKRPSCMWVPWVSLHIGCFGNFLVTALLSQTFMPCYRFLFPTAKAFFFGSSIASSLHWESN